MVDLLPCPHCGETRLLYPSHHLNRMTGKVSEKPFGVDCVECGYEFAPRAGMDVVAMWNRRFDPTDLTAIAELQRRETDARLSNEVNTGILREVLDDLGITDELGIPKAIADRFSLMAKLGDELKGVIRILDAVKFQVGLGKNQLDRMNSAKALLDELAKEDA